MTVFAGMGVMITSATFVIFGKEIWEPIDLVGNFAQKWVVAMATFTIVVATLSVNIAANVVSPANDFANAFPKLITFRRGGFITGVVGILMMPWKLLENPKRYIDGWLVGYSGGLGSIAGVLILDYWIVKRRELQLADLYQADGAYAGWNWRGIVSTLAGCVAAWIGLVVPALRPLYSYAWFIGFAVAGGLYVALSQTRRVAVEMAAVSRSPGSTQR
jgi:NCS1 family nucleobase:cation symporter-1